MDETRQRGSFIAKKRKELGLTQKQLAEQINVTDKAVSKWENGKGFPDTSLIKPLAQALHISVVELLDGKEVEQEQLQEKTENRVLDEISDSKKSKKRYRKIIVLVVLLMGTVIFISMLNRSNRNVTCEKFEVYTKDITSLLENVSECIQTKT